VKDKDVDAVMSTEPGHFVRYVLGCAHAKTLARSIGMQIHDAAIRTVGIATAARDERRKPVAPPRGDWAAPIGPGQGRKFRRVRRGYGKGVACFIAKRKSGDCSLFSGRVECPHQGWQDKLRFVPTNRIDLGKIRQDLAIRERPKVSTAGDVARIVSFAESNGKTEKIGGACLKGEGQRNQAWPPAHDFADRWDNIHGAVA
jgi:hypothetical protein